MAFAVDDLGSCEVGVAPRGFNQAVTEAASAAEIDQLDSSIVLWIDEQNVPRGEVADHDLLAVDVRDGLEQDFELLPHIAFVVLLLRNTVEGVFGPDRERGVQGNVLHMVRS